jgi:hypothetical protein
MKKAPVREPWFFDRVRSERARFPRCYGVGIGCVRPSIRAFTPTLDGLSSRNAPAEFGCNVNRWVSHSREDRGVNAPMSSTARKSPARFPARAHFVSFNFVNSLICANVSSADGSPEDD